ncbi:protein-glutamine gamma-glutamyltransferase [Fonticella tunisiensis]|uniref:Protein-glutamine gamma-glutamyltransferase n=1 Tax=Fonticella tunisiensis TaxID=1096341 RepID=A0A4R7KCQ8_9CLOT|nr:protein-glutamine gamma-glutamyltransferase [Fonticella tunisiensis]TDT51227.1 protein-glutamine gamma-glutamyltransferase [Fonticella tunisiensis]
MIKISGSPINSNDVLNQYPQNSIERKIISILSSSSSTYNYKSLKELKFELNLRVNIINASRELNGTNFAFAVFRKSRCNPDYWERTDEGGFLLKKGVKPSHAIKDIYINASKYATECATAMVIVYYKALLNIFPEELFNDLFSEIYLMDWQHIDRDLGNIGYMEKEEDYLPGDRRYFKNPAVDPVHPEWQGENAIDLGDGTYYGHGIGIKTAEKIIDILNKLRKNDAQISAYLMDLAGRPDFKYLADKFYSFSSRLLKRNYKIT